jgi:thioesterase domain-containing protein
LGGWFAYETARQLRLRGRDVALLAQFDTHINCIIPDEVRGRSDRLLAREYVWKHLRRLASHPASLWRVLGKLPARIRRARQWRVADPIRGDRHGAIVARHRASPYDGPVDYFRSVDSLPAVLGMWKRWCPGGVTVHPIPGDHHEIIRGANAGIVAGIVRGIIRERAGKAAVPVESPQRSGA